MPIVLMDNVAFKHRLSVPDLEAALAHISQCRIKAGGLSDSLFNAMQSGDEAAQKSATAALLSDPASLVAAAIAANKRIKPAKRQRLERCLAVPSLLSFQSPFSEEVPFYIQPKKSEGVRPIHNPRLLHRTAQTLIRKILGSHFVPRSFQFTHAGVPAAINQVKSLAKAGFVHTARLDVKDYFISFKLEKLIPELPLEKEVVEHAVVGRHMKVVLEQETHQTLPHTDIDLLLLARLGIPQGSGCSPIVGMFCMSRLPWAPMKGVALVNYADDFLLMAATPAALEKAMEKLTAAVTDLPGGHFTLALSDKGPLKHGCEFLGHVLRIRDGQLKTSPTVPNVQELYCRAHRIEERLNRALYGIGKPPNKAAATERLVELFALMTGWKAAFCECDNSERYVAPLIAALEEGLEAVGLSVDQLKPLVEPSMMYRPGDYAFGH